MVVSGVLLATSLGGQDVEEVLRKFRADEDSIRVQAFYELIEGPTSAAGLQQLFEREPEHREAITKALLELLAREQQRFTFRPSLVVRSEAAGEYIGDLLEVVAALQDPRAARVLLPAVGIGGMVREGLAALGEDALPLLLDDLSMSEHESTRVAILRTLQTMSERQDALGLRETHAREIRGAGLRSLEDEAARVRSAAIGVLFGFPDEEVRDRIAHLAATDPSSRVQDGVVRFPVREDARRWLEAHPRL
jgi:hypothetical protein